MKLNFSAPSKVTLPLAIHLPHYDPSQSCAHTKFIYFMVFQGHHKKSKSVPAVLILLWSPERCQTSCLQLWDSQSLWIFKDNNLRNQFIFNYNHCIRTINWITKVRMKPIMKEHKWLCAALKITLTWQFSSVHSPLYLLNCWQKLLWYIRTKENNYVNKQNASTKPRSNAIRQTHSFAVQKQYKVKNNSSGKIEWMNEIPGELSRESMISSHVKITCYFQMWKYHRCYGYIINRTFAGKNCFSKMVWYFIGIYIINRTLHDHLEIRNSSSCVKNNISTLEEKFHIYVQPCNILYVL